MTTTITYRKATIDDVAELSAFAQKAFPLATPDTVDADAIHQFVETKLSVEVFTDWLNQSDSVILIAHDAESGQIVGYSASFFNVEPTDPEVAARLQHRPTMELNKFYVDSNFHGVGLSHELMTRTKAEAKAWGAEGLWLGMNKRNERAHKFYKKFGFDRILGERLFTIGYQELEDYLLEAHVDEPALATDAPATPAETTAV